MTASYREGFFFRALSSISGVLKVPLDGLIELIWPTRCVGCEVPGSLLCDQCTSELPFIDQATACERCGAPFGRLVCTECAATEDYPFTATRAAGSFTGVLARMLVTFKDGGERRLAAVIARLIALAAQEDWRVWAQAVVFVPASAEAMARRGFDHMELVGRQVSKMIHVPLCDVLLRRSTTDQRLLGRAERTRNVQGSFQVLAPSEVQVGLPVTGLNVLLIDDVFTTGATLAAAAESLLLAGAREVRVVVAARVW